MRTHENTSETLKTRASSTDCHPHPVSYQRNIVRFSIKDLQKDYKKTEDDIKAVQSVGQIIGEVMKQLDDDRCTYTVTGLHCMRLNFFVSYRQGLVRTAIRRVLPPHSTCTKAKDRDTR